MFKPEVASLNMGSINFGLYMMLNRYKEFKHDWNQNFWKAQEILCLGILLKTSSTF